MKVVALVLLTLFCLGGVLTGCSSGDVSEADQQAKVKAMNDIAKDDPDMAARRAQHDGVGRN